MERFLILGKKRWDGKHVNLGEVVDSDTGIAERANRIFGKMNMQEVVVIGEEMQIVFRVTRRCKCTNVQHTLDGRLVCEGCGLDYSKTDSEVEDVARV